MPSQDTFSLDASQLGAPHGDRVRGRGLEPDRLQCTGAGADSSTNLGDRKATLDIDAGETVVCTFTNTKGSSLTVVKVTDPASDPQDFDFDLTGPGVPADLDLDTDAGNATLPSQDTFSLDASQLGAHTVTESAVAGWSLTDLQCTGAGADSSTNLGDRKATLDIDAGETVVCTFTNTKDATVKIVKDAVPDGSAGLRVHDDRVCGCRLLARRRRRRDAAEHEDVHGLGRQLRRQDGDRGGGGRLVFDRPHVRR